MRLDQAFRKAGFVITGATTSAENNKITMLVRIPGNDNVVVARWRQWLEDVLVMAERKAAQSEGGWGLDVSKKIYSEKGSIKYIWRVVITGNIVAAQAVMTQSTINALRVGVELDSIELVGASSNRPDPKNGKFKGVYTNSNEHNAAVSLALGGQ